MAHTTRGTRRRALQRTLAHFHRDQSGSATVEAVIWIPAFFALIILVTDASLAFFGRAEAFRAVQDGNRAYAVGRLTTPNAVKAWIEAEMEPIAPNAVATTTVSGGLVSSSLVMPASDLLLFGSLDTVSLTVRSQHYVE